MRLPRVYRPLTLAGLLAGVGCLLAGPGLSRADAAPEPVVRESRDSFESGGKAITVDRFEPAADGRVPAIILLHGAEGMEVGGHIYRKVARDLALRGYATFIIHYYNRTGTKAGVEDRILRQNFLTWMKTVTDSVGYATRQPNVDPKRVGLLGISLGAYLSLSVAAFDPRIAVVVDYFGGLPDIFADRVRKMPPTLILHGDADKIVSVEEARKLERVLREKRQPYEIKIYHGQGHGFTGADAKDAADRAFDFFDKFLKGVAGTASH
jgi:carboxymethylenebutenolidase